MFNFRWIFAYFMIELCKYIKKTPIYYLPKSFVIFMINKTTLHSKFFDLSNRSRLLIRSNTFHIAVYLTSSMVTHWKRDKTAVMLQTTFSNRFITHPRWVKFCQCFYKHHQCVFQSVVFKTGLDDYTEELKVAIWKSIHLGSRLYFFYQEPLENTIHDIHSNVL